MAHEILQYRTLQRVRRLVQDLLTSLIPASMCSSLDTLSTRSIRQHEAFAHTGQHPDRVSGQRVLRFRDFVFFFDPLRVLSGHLQAIYISAFFFMIASGSLVVKLHQIGERFWPQVAGSFMSVQNPSTP